MAYEEDPLDTEVLHIPPTRPNMFLRVPYELAVLFMMLFFASDTMLHSWKAGFLVIPLWAAAAVLVRRDLNGVRVAMVRMRLLTVVLDAHRWGGLSADPYPIRPCRRLRGMGRHAV